MDRLYGNGRKFTSFLLNLSHFYTVCVSVYVCVHTMHVYPCMCVCLQASVYLRVHVYHLCGYIYHLCDNLFILYDTKINNTCICYQMSYLVLTNNGDDKLNDYIHRGCICITVDRISSPTREALNTGSFHWLC